MPLKHKRTVSPFKGGARGKSKGEKEARNHILKQRSFYNAWLHPGRNISWITLFSWLSILLPAIHTLGSSKTKSVLKSHLLLSRWAGPAMHPRTTTKKKVLDFCLLLHRSWSEDTTQSSIFGRCWRIWKKGQQLKKIIASTWMKKMALAITIHWTFQLCFSYFIMSLSSPVPCILQGRYCGIIRIPQFSSFSKVIANALENCRVWF